MLLGTWFSSLWFRWVHGKHLVYNACWEDPRLDRQALDLGPEHRVATITSAGCNALEYALAGAQRVDAVDVNYRQNALLELKIAGIRRLDFDTFFQLFGRGYHRRAHSIYRHELRAELSPPARRFWDRRIGWFAADGARRSFYFFGTTGLLAWFVNTYIDRVAKVRGAIEELLQAPSLAEQQRRYSGTLHHAFWRGFVRWLIGQDATLAMLGVPRLQRRQVESGYPGGIARFVEDRITDVLTKIPLADNYFWRLYLTGRYTADCCPEYLKRDNFQRLKDGLVDRVHLFTGTLLNFLEQTRGPIHRFVLLDHMDWLSMYCVPLLRRQWQALIDRAAPESRVLWRSGGLRVDYLDPLRIVQRGHTRRLGNLLTYHDELAGRLHAQDRVHTYGSFYIADIQKE
jgi:S-adenosylmethionine-diacylglycerol 3-amino-3-carboxypropyl transferase